jgi:hypothetical protein
MVIAVVSIALTVLLERSRLGAPGTTGPSGLVPPSNERKPTRLLD